jgi:hypothetical protein
LRLPFPIRAGLCTAFALVCTLSLADPVSFAQRPIPQARTTGKSATSPAQSPAKESIPVNPAQLELLETKYRFAADGSSRKEVHARVRIHNELGARQFARLNFDYNRSFESVEIPLVRITHAKGGVADILPSAITDNPKPEVTDAPAYQDVRAKSVRILGLQPTDILEYRVITTVAHAPLAPNFYLSHSFDRSGVVVSELFELDLPAVPSLQIRINPKTPASATEKPQTGGRTVYRWKRVATKAAATEPNPENQQPDITLSTFGSWENLYAQFAASLRAAATDDGKKKVSELAAGRNSAKEKFEAIYRFVSQKIRTVDLPAGATGFRTRSASEIISTGYATPEDKCGLFIALATAAGLPAEIAIADPNLNLKSQLPRISPLNHFLIAAGDVASLVWLDPSLEVAPFAMLPSNLRGREALTGAAISAHWTKVPDELPYPAKQQVHVEAAVDAAGKLNAKVHYSLRGDNELVLRIAFHQSAKEKWNELAQLLSISDGFRGQILSVDASDPYATDVPFTVDYEISTPKFVDWSKKPVRIPALLPQVGLPDPPGKPAEGSAVAPILLGTPLEVETTAKLQLPADTTAQTPTGTSVERDYATFSSSYSFVASTINASRHINFILREVPATRVADYNAFLHAVQSDSAQLFILMPPPNASPTAVPATPAKP